MLQIKSDKSNFELDFNGTGVEEDAFLDAVGLAIEIKKGQSNQGTKLEKDIEEKSVEIIKETVKKVEEPVAVEYKKTEPAVEIVSKSTESVEQKEVAVNKTETHTHTTPTTPTNNRKLVIGLCEECEDQYGIFIYDDAMERETYGVTCRECGHDNAIYIKDLIPARMQCECGKANNFYMEACQYKNIECKNCGTGVDMVYHEKHKKMVSANLL